MKTLKVFIASLVCSVAAPPIGAQSAIHEFDLSNGVFPSGTETANLSGVLPYEGAYKHGYTENGWTIDRLENRGYVALSPTYTIANASSDNLLKLPPVEIGEGCFLKWEAKSVYRHFPESYRVTAYPEDGSEAVVLYECAKEAWTWTLHQIALDKLAGKNVRIGFTCTSEEGYMLALTEICIADELIVGVTDPDVEPASEFTRALVVDEGTGMWCVNCPAGETVLNGLRERFGKRLITLSTHVNDALANPPYWEELKWYSVPRMMLNRIKATEGENAKKFEEYYDLPTSFAVSVSLPAQEENTLKMTARVKVNERIDNSSDRYRVGFVVTGDFHRPDEARFRQKNNCTQPTYGAYYFLPSEIPAALMYYDNVTLSAETAFTGIESSLPAIMVPGEVYEVECATAVPSLLGEDEETGVVALVLDSETGQIMNAAVGEDAEMSGVEDILATSTIPLLITGGGEGIVTTSLQPGEDYTFEAFGPEGTLLSSFVGKAKGADTLMLPPNRGVMIVRLSTSNSSQTVKILR